MRSLLILISCSIGARASSLFELSELENVRRNLSESGRELQFDGVCRELLSVFPFDGCRCNLNTLQNNVQIVCDDYCDICSSAQDLCVAYSYTIQFTLVPPLQPQRAIIKEVQTGQASSRSALVVETQYSANQELLSCTTSINDNLCTSCRINTACADAIHDCRNLGLPAVVDACNTNQLRALPSTNPFSTLANDNLSFDQCDAPSNTVPAPAPVRPPVPAPTGSSVPPKKTPPMDKEKDRLKLSNFDAGRGGLGRKLKSIRGK